MLWLALGLTSAGVTIAAFFPAAWVAAIVEKQTAGRLTLGDAQGTLWDGSAFIGVASSRQDAVTPLLPGRFNWRVSPLILVGRIDATLENTAALSQPVSVSGTWRQWQVGPAAIVLPAERLAGLGSPLNTIQPAGQMRLSWEPLQCSRQDRQLAITGKMTLELMDIASRLSPIKPLGAYRLTVDWQGHRAPLQLVTVKGPLLLSGTGMLAEGRMQFSGKAEAAPEQQEKLANLLNLLGQRRKEGDKNVIALEFK